MPKSVLVPVADGTEEIEAVTIIDILRRAGADVVVASVQTGIITASRGVKLVADCLIADCLQTDFDLVVLPGGMPGAEHLRDSADLRDILQRQADRGGLYAAICAAPAVVLEPHGLLNGLRATAHPAFMNRLRPEGAVEDTVVVDGNCVTSRGPGTAMAFALTLVERLFGASKRDAVAAPLVCQGSL